MLGFKFTIESLYFTSFRKSTSTSLLSSYKIPPFTTIRGLISNALGLKRDDSSIAIWENDYEKDHGRIEKRT